MNPRLLFGANALVLCGCVGLAAADPKPEAASPIAAPPAASAAGAAATPVSAPARPVATPPAAPATPTARTFDAFRGIGERNIFNPNRVGRVVRGAVVEQPRVDTLSLVGTMQSDDGLRAFFDSANASYRKALREGESVAQFTVKRIANDGVELARDGKVIAFKIGQQLRRPEGGEWSVIGAELVQAARAAEASAASEAGAPPAIPADASDTLRRLMEQRQKQLKQ